MIYNKKWKSFSLILCCEEVHPGLIPRGLLGSIPKRSIARMAKLVYAYDLKSYPTGCWFNSSYEHLTNIFYLRKTKMFNKSRYSRNRQLARVIFYFSLYINILIIYGIFFVIYGLSFESDYFLIVLLVETLISFFVFYLMWATSYVYVFLQ